MMRLVLVLSLITTAFADAESRPLAFWQEVLGSGEGKVPAVPDGAVVWRTDLKAALAEARSAGRPLLVTWRCLPCKQCAAFDKDVLEGGPELGPLLKQFVTVRMTDAAQLDERYFPYRGFQDLDLSWWGYFLSPEGKLYGVFGGKDHVSDTTRISVPAFANSMRRVLAHHHDPRRAGWGIDGTAPAPDQAKRTPVDIAGYQDYRKGRKWLAKQTCLHCHQVNDVLHTEAMRTDTFDLRQYTQGWPLPENVGIHLDRDDGLLVAKVEPGSAAARAGLLAGDRLGMAGGRKLFGQADFRGVLHRADYDAATIPIAFVRDGEVKLAKLETGDDWRAGENSWRKSVYEGVIGPHLGFFPLHGPRHGKGTMSLKAFIGPKRQKESEWFKAGLRGNMEIVEVNGRSDDWDSRQFLAWFRLNHKAGDTVTVKIRGGREFSIVLEEREIE